MNVAEDCDLHVGGKWIPNEFCSIVAEQVSTKTWYAVEQIPATPSKPPSCFADVKKLPKLVLN
jgi:hypothetical protein